MNPILKPIQDMRPVSIYSHQSLDKRSFNGFGLPPEVWLLIFPNLHSSDLRMVSSVCKPFRYMAQPLLFSVLDVSPFLLSYNTEEPVLRSQKYLSRLLERLECYKQPHIAPGVRHCWVSPYTRSGFAPRNSQDDLDPSSIINALLEYLPTFPNLTTLSWHCIDITPNWWSVIQSLKIKNLWLNSSSVPTSSSPLSYIVHLDLDDWPWQGNTTTLVSMVEERGNGVGQTALNHVIQPDLILSISVPRHDTACHVFLVLSQTISHLRILKIPFFSISDSKFIPTLRMCPRLEALSIFPPTFDTPVQDIALDTIPSTCLPFLADYDGPYTHLLNISHQPLKHLSLWGFHKRAALCSPDALTETLSRLAERNNVESLRSLTVLVIGITSNLLKSFSAFEYLEHLSIQSQEKDLRFFISDLYNMIGTIALPSNLKTIELSSRLVSEEDIIVQENQAASFIQAFASRYPKIQQIDILYGRYWTGMCTVKWGRLRETNDESFIIKKGDSSQAGSTERKFNTSDRYSSKSSSNHCLLSTIVSSVNPLPLGKLTFVEHRRMIIFENKPSSSAAVSRSPMHHDSVSGLNQPSSWMNLWLRFKRFFWKDYLNESVNSCR